MTDERDAIHKESRELERARRSFQEEAMRDYNENVYYPARRALRERCSRLGHNWSFTHVGPLGDPWFFCTTCRTSECRREER